MSSTELKDTPIALNIKVMHVVRLVIGTLARFFFSLYYASGGKKIPTITDDILKQPAVEVARKIRNKEITSVEVVEACIRRIKDVNSELNCFIEDRFQLALNEAEAADELIRGGTISADQLETEKPFLGVPFTTKDSIGVKGLHQTAGVVMHKDTMCEQDADVIRLLCDKGAIVIGLTNVPEICMWWETHNHIHGRCNNPYDTTRIVGGSSGGEGCLQAAGGSIFGVGSDIGGSIRMPAYFNGIFGHKPSRSIVSLSGLFPNADEDLTSTFLGVGPMTRYAVDLKPLLKIMSGECSSKLNLDKPVDIGSLKIFYQFSNDAPLVDPVDPDIIAAMNKVVEYFKVKHNLDAQEKKISRLRKSAPIWMTTMKTKKAFEEWIMKKKGLLAIVVEIFKSFIGCSANTLIALFTALFDNLGAELGSKKYLHHCKARENLEKTFTEMLGDDGVFLYPTHPTAAPYHNEPLFRPMNFAYTAIINCLGLPATTVPLGLGKEGLPIGLQVIANHNNDRLCLAVAEELDKAFGGWVEPQKK